MCVYRCICVYVCAGKVDNGQNTEKRYCIEAPARSTLRSDEHDMNMKVHGRAHGTVERGRASPARRGERRAPCRHPHTWTRHSGQRHPHGGRRTPFPSPRGRSGEERSPDLQSTVRSSIKGLQRQKRHAPTAARAATAYTPHELQYASPNTP